MRTHVASTLIFLCHELTTNAIIVYEPYVHRFKLNKCQTKRLLDSAATCKPHEVYLLHTIEVNTFFLWPHKPANLEICCITHVTASNTFESILCNLVLYHAISF